MQPIALDYPLGAHAYVSPEGPLQRAHVEASGIRHILDTQERAVHGQALDEIAHTRDLGLDGWNPDAPKTASIGTTRSVSVAMDAHTNGCNIAGRNLIPKTRPSPTRRLLNRAV